MHNFVGMAVCVMGCMAWSALSYAQTPSCDQLGTEMRAKAQKLLSSQHMYACCDRTIGECLQEPKVCRLARRLAENICTRVGKGQDSKTIARLLAKRASSMLPSFRKAVIKLEGFPFIGARDAPVVLVEYACARCPYCSKITPKLYNAVNEGPLQGKVKLVFKPFPIRGHQHSKEAALAFVAAAELGRFWPFMLHAYGHYEQFSLEAQHQWAATLGMDQQAFHRALNADHTRAALIESKKEGLANKVTATPTFYINGRKYVGEMSEFELIDVLEEEFERIKGLDVH